MGDAMTTTTPLTSISDLLRRCSPVVSLAAPERRGVIVDMQPGATHAVVALEADRDHDASLEWLPLADLCLDLDDKTGQQHAGLYLWERPTPPGVDYSGLIRGACVGRAHAERLRMAVLNVHGVTHG